MKFCLDRFEGDKLICLCEDEGAPISRLILTRNEHPLLSTAEEGMIFEARLTEDGTLSDIRLLPHETEERRTRARSRLHALAARTKKNKRN